MLGSLLTNKNAWLMAELADVTVAPPLPNPPWVRWDHTDSTSM